MLARRMASPLALEALLPLLPARARLIGVDLGTKTIGLALSDVERRIATPLLTIERTAFARDAEALNAQVQKFEVFALVLGRLATAAVNRALIANDVTRATRADVVDKMAAAYILQGALDSLARMKTDETRGLT